MTNRLKAGLVISMRVNPKDCMSVVDVLSKTGLIIPGMSFSAMCSLALSSLLETMRQQELIPTRSGFEFSEMLAPYLQGKNAQRVAAAKAIETLGSDFSAPALPRHEAVTNPSPQQKQREIVGELPQPPEVQQTTEQRQAARRLTELLQKRDLAEDGNGGVVWSASDQREYDECYAVVYPEG